MSLSRIYFLATSKNQNKLEAHQAALPCSNLENLKNWICFAITVQKQFVLSNISYYWNKFDSDILRFTFEMNIFNEMRLLPTSETWLRSHGKVETSYQLKINPRKSHGLKNFLLCWFDTTQKFAFFWKFRLSFSKSVNLCNDLLLDFFKIWPFDNFYVLLNE